MGELQAEVEVVPLLMKMTQCVHVLPTHLIVPQLVEEQVSIGT